MQLDYEPKPLPRHKPDFSLLRFISAILTAGFVTSAFCCNRTMDWTPYAERCVFWLGILSFISSMLAIWGKPKALERWIILLLDCVGMVWFVAVAQAHLFFF